MSLKRFRESWASMMHLLLVTVPVFRRSKNREFLSSNCTTCAKTSKSSSNNIISLINRRGAADAKKVIFDYKTKGMMALIGREMVSEFCCKGYYYLSFYSISGFANIFYRLCTVPELRFPIDI